MDIRLVKDGELQAVNNIDIISEVEGGNTVQQIVPEGTFAKQGDVLISLDSSTIKQKLEDATLDTQRAEADVTTSREMKQIQESQNDANNEAAEVALTLAKLDLQQYAEGKYPQDLANAKTELEMARINLKNKEEDLGQTRSLFAKGFVTAADVKKAELDVTVARNDVSKASNALDALSKYTHEMDLVSRKSNLAQAEQKLLRSRQEGVSALAQKVADLRAKEQVLEMARRRLDRFKEQYQNCTIKAPADGMVVYASSSDRSGQGPLQEGATVRERQLLLRLPDTSAMKAVVRIQENQVSKLQIGQRATIRIVGVSSPVSATLTKISVLADNSQRWWNPDLKEYPVELELDQTPPGLKPGVGVTAEIFVARFNGVLAVPLTAIYSAGQDQYVFVEDGENVRPVHVTVGASNETHIQITRGLSAGQQVLLLQAGQGRELLERSGVKIAPTTRPDLPKGKVHSRKSRPVAR